MIEAIEKGINPVLIQNNMPELKVKVGIDEGEDLIIQYGHDTTSLIDILGYTMNRTAKITSLSPPNGITIGQNVFVDLPLDMKQNYKEVRFDTKNGSISICGPENFINYIPILVNSELAKKPLVQIQKNMILIITRSIHPIPMSAINNYKIKGENKRKT